MGFEHILRSFRGPRLYRIHRHESTVGKNYTPYFLETVGDSVVKWMRFLWSASCWTSPILLTVLYRRGAFTVAGMYSAVAYGSSFAVVLVAAVLIREWFTQEGMVAAGAYGKFMLIMIVTAVIVRGIGRAMNPDYQRFMKVLLEAQKNYSRDTKKALERFDSEFWAWPVDFRWDQAGSGHDKPKVPSPKPVAKPGDLKGVHWNLLSYLSASTFGIRMVYPGKTSLINALVGQALMMGRAKLIEERKFTTRAKLRTRDGNDIDSLLVDRRNQREFQAHGNTLVVCCEGNSGFYEIGSTVTPLDAGYSVLGWNHPGFSGSTGCPWPEQEQNAVDCVMQYAIYKLGFKPEDIVLYAWSIGGYSASWAAMNYPDVRFVVLDATFDHLIPLAIPRMPQSFKKLVEVTVQKYINLNNAEQLKKYPGPVLLVRRSRDEMITTENPTVVASNRGNDLLIQLLQHRYPKLVDDSTLPILKQYLAESTANIVERELTLSSMNVERDLCEGLFRSYADQHSTSYPMYVEANSQEEKKQLVIFLASEYMRDFDSTHCVPLPGNMFTEPWTL